MTLSIVITGTPETIARTWCIYELFSPDTASLEYIGYCLLVDVLKMPDLRRRADFEDDRAFILKVVQVCGSKTLARRAAVKRINENGMPELNKQAMLQRHMGIKCVQTGRVFKTPADCIEAFGMAQSALSNHLNKKVGYKSINGKTFVRVKL